MTASAALPHSPAPRPEPTRLRRVSTARETAHLVVAGGLPDGYERPADQGRWRDHLRVTLGPGQFRADRRATLVAVATALMRHADWDTLTTRPTWAVLVDRCRESAGHGSRRTIARAIATLIELQLIARVASGRRGCYTPEGCRARSRGRGPCLAPDTCPASEAAVYVLIVPTRLRAVPDHQVADASHPVDTNGTPPPGEVSEAHPVRAHARLKDQNEPLRGTDFRGPARAPATSQAIPNRHEPLWPAWATTGSQGARFAASAELQRRLPVLRQISTRDVRSCLRAFFLAGWSVRDVEHALDWQPDGSRWPHDGANGIGPTMVRGWIRHRLTPWTTEGTPRRSFSQQAEAERAHQRAVERVRREREQAHQATVAATPPAQYRQAREHLKHVRWSRPEPGCPQCLDEPSEVAPTLNTHTPARGSAMPTTSSHHEVIPQESPAQRRIDRPELA